MENSISAPTLSPDAFFTPARLYALLLRFWYLPLCGAILGGVIASLGVHFFIKPVFQANATVYAWKKNSNAPEANRNATTQELQLGSQLINDYQELLLSRKVQKEVEHRLHSFWEKDHTTPLPPYSITTKYARNTRIVTIIGRSPSPEIAQLSADETTKVFTSLIQDILLLDNVQVIDHAECPVKPVSPRMLFYAIGGILIGIAGGSLLAVIFMLCDHTIKTPDQAAREFNKVVAGIIPLLDFKDLSGKERPLLTSISSSMEAESLRLLRTNLQYLLPVSSASNGNRTLMLTSSMPGEGKSSIITSLAVVIAQTSKRVLLIDCDLRKPRQSEIFDLDNSRGLTSVLAGLENFDTVVYHGVGEKTLDILTSGPQPPNPSELLMSDAFKKLLSELRKEYDYILIDAPPCLQISDPLIISQFVDATFLLVACNYTRVGNARRALAQLEMSGIPVPGIILNKYRMQQRGYGYYYDSSYGYYDASDDTPAKKKK